MYDQTIYSDGDMTSAIEKCLDAIKSSTETPFVNPAFVFRKMIRSAVTRDKLLEIILAMMNNVGENATNEQIGAISDLYEQTLIVPNVTLIANFAQRIKNGLHRILSIATNAYDGSVILIFLQTITGTIAKIGGANQGNACNHEQV